MNSEAVASDPNAETIELKWSEERHHSDGVFVGPIL
jgi:hypothetical protein